MGQQTESQGAAPKGAGGGLPVPRVERREWVGPTSRIDGRDYTTTHWVVVTADGPLLNTKGRVKKFRRHYTADAARAALAKAGASHG